MVLVEFFESVEYRSPDDTTPGWDDDVPCWSCFAPVYNSAGEVVCIVGMDMPCELLEDYPEWNRDREEWNGIEE